MEETIFFIGLIMLSFSILYFKQSGEALKMAKDCLEESERLNVHIKEMIQYRKEEKERLVEEIKNPLNCGR